MKKFLIDYWIVGVTIVLFLLTSCHTRRLIIEEVFDRKKFKIEYMKCTEEYTVFGKEKTDTYVADCYLEARKLSTTYNYYRCTYFIGKELDRRYIKTTNERE